MPEPDHSPDPHVEQRRAFLRMVSHELRTPLNSILGFSEILTSELYGPLGVPQYKEYAGIIRESGQKLLKLVNQVLEIARLEAGAVEMDLRAEPLSGALEDVLGLLAPELADRAVSIEIEGEPAPAVAADPRGLRAVLLNLLHSAAAFSPEGGAVRVGAVRQGGEVEIVVVDDGEGGLEPRRGPEAGLGLRIAELTCRAMGGSLALTCRPGGGVAAAVRLPAA